MPKAMSEEEEHQGSRVALHNTRFLAERAFWQSVLLASCCVANVCRLDANMDKQMCRPELLGTSVI